MKSKTIMSRHAMKRNNQRTSMHEMEVAKLLGSGKVVNLGRKPGSMKEHLLFYSKEDDTCFVAIQDKTDGKIVTILPLDYHERLAWRITQEQQEAAKQLVIAEPIIVEDLSNKAIIIRAHYVVDGRQKTKTLCKMKNDVCAGVLEDVISDNDVFEEIEKQIAEKELEMKSIFAISARLGESGKPVFRDL